MLPHTPSRRALALRPRKLHAFIGRVVGDDPITDCLAYVLNEQTGQWILVGNIGDANGRRGCELAVIPVESVRVGAN